MEEDFVFLHSSSTFFSWMAVAHIHTSIQKEAFTRSPGIMIINIILRTITLTLMSRHTRTTVAEAATSIKLEQQPLFSSILLSLFSTKLTLFPFSFSLKLKTHHLLSYTMWPNVSMAGDKVNKMVDSNCNRILTKSPLATLVLSFYFTEERTVVYMVHKGKWYDRMNGGKKKLSEKAISLLRLNLIWSGGGSMLTALIRNTISRL